MNGDGFADVAVGAQGQDDVATNEGSVFIYAGTAVGLSTTPSLQISDPTHQLNAYFGLVFPAGDLNSDGFGDLVIGAPAQDTGAVDEGNAFVYHGSAAGFPTTPTASLDNPTNQMNAYFGSAITNADLNDDGFSDLVVGAYYQAAGAGQEGNAFVYYGSAGGIATSPTTTLDNPTNQMVGWFGYALGAGDFNGNGYHDLIVGAPHQNNPAAYEGNAFVYIGSSTGIGTVPSSTLDSPADQVQGTFGRAISSGTQ